MALAFCNGYTSVVSVAILWYLPNCSEGSDWAKAGWYVLDPGQCMTVFDADLDEINRYWYYYAEAADGAIWAGDIVTPVPNEAFNWCMDTSNTGAREVGFLKLDVNDNDDFTVNLVPL